MTALMATPRPITLIFLCLLSLWPSSVYASRPFLATEKSEPIERGTSRLEMGYEYARFSDSDHRQTVLIEMTHGLINNMDFEVEVPTVFAKQVGDSQAGLGDLRLKSKVRFLKGREANPLSLSGQLVIKFPTCDEDKKPIRDLNSTCTGEVDVGLVGIASKSFAPVTVHLNLGYTFVGNPPSKPLDDVFLYDLAFEYDTPLRGLSLVTDLMGESNNNLPGPNPLAFLYGAVYELVPNLEIDGAFSAGLTEGSPDYTLTVGLAYFF